jgi:hypothetical protein
MILGGLSEFLKPKIQVEKIVASRLRAEIGHRLRLCFRNGAILQILPYDLLQSHFKLRERYDVIEQADGERSFRFDILPRKN